MKSSILLYLLCISFSLFAQDTFRLAPPLLKYASVFFSNKAIVEIKFAQRGTVVHYNLNDQEPTELDPIYTKPLLIKNNFTRLTAKVFGNGFYASETIAATFIRDGKTIQSIVQTSPNILYPGSGVNTLKDNIGGSNELTNNTWMGYNCDTVTVSLNLKKKQVIDKVLLHFFQNESSWIFLPEEIIVFWFDNSTNSFQPFGDEKIFTDKENLGPQCINRIIEIKSSINTDKILIKIVVQKKIPSWHPAKGAHAWMFIDEIKVY